MNQKLSYKIYTLGCKVNQYDSTSLDGKLKASGFKLVKEKADIAIINSCAVTKTAIQKAKRMISKARNENPEAKIILMGCWPKIYKKDVNNIGVDFIFGVGEADKMIKKIKNELEVDVADKKELSSDPLRSEARASELSSFLSSRSRYFIKIQDGCEQFCSYCIIPYARGKLKSRSEKDVLGEIRAVVSRGYREVVLSGIHLGMYGQKKAKLPSPLRRSGYGGRVGSLASLIKKMIKIKKLGRVRLSSIEASEISDNLIKLMSTERTEQRPYICKHLHIPLQSGSDKILKLMNRPYTVKDFKNKVEKIKSLIPDIAISTDIIVGFPGETDKDFSDTIKLVKKLKFSRLHVFPFSAHEKTPAASLPNRVGDNIKTKRAIELRKLGKRLEGDYRAKFKGKKLELLVERVENNKYIGKSEYYFDVLFSEGQIIGNSINKKNITGQIVLVKCAE